MKARKSFGFKMLVIIGCGFSIFSALLGIGYISLASSTEYAALSEIGVILGAVMLILGIFGFGAHWRLWRMKRDGLTYVMAINILITAFFLLLIVLNGLNALAPINFMALWGIAVISYLIPKNYTTKKPQEEIPAMSNPV
ncbi:MAG: hypothetical protein HYU56_03450 [Candidatus Aenigmarchaeota archaeon]|nr:hypothetical protein [Candidatus Aenigmarchaeota archaeon]